MRPYYTNNSEISDHYDASTPYTGFLLNGCSINIGQKNAVNTFKFTRTTYGIHAANSTVTINGCIFDKIYGINTQTDFWGSGIYGLNSTINCYKGTFSDVFYSGIYVAASSLIVSKSTFTHCLAGIFAENNTNGQVVSIKENIFTMNSSVFQETRSSSVSGFDNFGLLLTRSSGGAGILNEIYQNKFYLGGNNSNSYSAWIEETSGSAGNEEIKFNHNKTTVTSTEDMVCGYKIRCFYSNNITIDTDTFHFDNPTVKTMRNGITAHSIGSGHKIMHNRFTSTNVKTQNIGFYGENFANGQYCDNRFKYCQLGFKLTGNCDRSELSTSLFELSNNGILIANARSEAGRLGEQDRRANEWDCPLPTNNIAGRNLSVIKFSKFWIETDNCVRYPSPSKIFPPAWFEQSMENEALGCSVPSSAPCIGTNGFSVYDQDIIIGNYPEGPVNGVHIFNADYQMLYRIWQNPSLLNCHDSAQVYFDANLSSNVSKLAQLMINIQSKIEIPETIQNELNTIQADRENIYKEMELLDDNYEWGDTTELDTNYLNAVTPLLMSLSLLKAQENSQYESILDHRNTEMALINTQNEDISANNQWESNLKFMNTFLIRLFTEQVTSADYAMVESIAEQDHELGGIAVLHAQVWFPQDSDGASLQKKETHTTLGESLSVSQSKVQGDLAKLELFPVPSATNEYSIRSIKKMTNIVVINSEGKTMFSFKVEGVYSSKLSLSKVSEGIYFIHCKFEDGTTEVRTVIKN